MQRLCTKFRSLASISSSHRHLHSSQQFYQRPLHFAAASSKWSRNGFLLNTSSSLTIQLPSLPFLPSFRLSPLSLSVRFMGFFGFVFIWLSSFFIYLFIVCMFTDEMPQINVFFFFQICTSFYIWFSNFAPNANHFFPILQTDLPQTNACRIIVQKGIVIIAKELNSEEDFEEPMYNLVQHLTSHAVHPSYVGYH